MSLRIGVDVGGTNTDAVLLDERDRVLARAKTPTTPDVEAGVARALAAVVADGGGERVGTAMLGTTRCTNAVVERRGLRRVAVMRLGAPATGAVPPFADWPRDLREVVEGRVSMIAGGHEFTGAELAPLDEDAVRRAASAAAAAGSPIALVGVFAAVNPVHERRAAELCAEEAGAEHPVSLSGEVGSIGLLERENATVLNAALADVGHVAAASFRRAVEAVCGGARCCFTQNDGTLMALDYAVRHPSLMLASGPANSMRGAAYLSDVADALIVDVGGTTTDVGVLGGGFPREAPFVVEVGGVRTSFRMPDVLSLALGGGTVVRGGGEGLRLGPDSVGYRLVEEGQVFGGGTATFTDAVVAAGRARVGSHAPALDRGDAARAVEIAVGMVGAALERMRPSRAPLPVVAVGGGGVLLPDRLGGGLEVVRPREGAVANAIGAAISEVSGGVDRIVAMGDRPPASLRAELEAEATAQAVRAGADPERVRIVIWEEVPLAYLPGNAARIRCKAAGRMAPSG